MDGRVDSRPKGSLSSVSVAVAVVVAVVVHGGAVLVEKTIGAVIGATIGILVRMKGAGHTERGLTMGIQ